MFGRAAVLLVGALLTSACVFEPNSAGPTDFGIVEDDAATADARPMDGAPADAELDAGTMDAAPIDLGPIDSGPNDTGTTDATPMDVIPTDAVPADAIPTDAEMDAGVIDTGFDAGTPDTGVDAGSPDGGFPYTPSNTPAPGLSSPFAWSLNSGSAGDDCVIDTSNGTFTGLGCGTNSPPAEIRSLIDNSSALVISVSSLSVNRLLTARGPNPVIILVYGDSLITRAIDFGANNTTSGPGANRANCQAGAGFINGIFNREAGGGGGYGQAGANGGIRTLPQMGGLGAPQNGNDILVPLHGGCRGGNATLNQPTHGLGGGGGGAIQISVAGTLELTSQAGIFSSGGGGLGGFANDGGGAGGGSGGAILIEAQNFILDAPLFAGGGGGGGGADNNNVDTAGEDGNISDGTVADGSPGDPAAGGYGGSGGIAPRTGIDAPNEGDDPSGNAGGGGGGGGAGRIRINVYGNTCTLTRRIWTGVLTGQGSICSF